MAVITDTFPTAVSGLSWTCAAAYGATCGVAQVSYNLNLTLPSFPAGGQVTITATGTAPASGTVPEQCPRCFAKRCDRPGSHRQHRRPGGDHGAPAGGFRTTVTIAPDHTGARTADCGDGHHGNIGPARPAMRWSHRSCAQAAPWWYRRLVVSHNPVTGTLQVIPYVPASTNPIVTYTVTLFRRRTVAPTSTVGTPDPEITPGEQSVHCDVVHPGASMSPSRFRSHRGGCSC